MGWKRKTSTRLSDDDIAARQVAFVEEARVILRTAGFIVMHIGAGEDGEPSFQFTVGLTDLGLSEVIVYGLGQEVGSNVLDELSKRLMAGERYALGETIPGLVEGDYRLHLRDAEWLTDPLGLAYQIYGDAFTVQQLVIPDTNDALPWEDRYLWPDLQPLLFTPPA